MTSNEYIKKLIKLSEENPELQIKAQVNSDCVPSDDFSWWIGDIGNSEIDEYLETDEETIVGEIQILVHIEYIIDGNLDLPDDLIDQEKMIQEYYDNLKSEGKIKKAIFVEIKP